MKFRYLILDEETSLLGGTNNAALHNAANESGAYVSLDLQDGGVNEVDFEDLELDPDDYDGSDEEEEDTLSDVTADDKRAGLT